MSGKYEYVVSACLAGMNCRYDGGSNPVAAVVDLYEKGLALAICPESLGGLKAPRLPCERKNGRIIKADGEDMSAAFLAGAEIALKMALNSGCEKAILKSRSPSCGYGKIYDGTFSKRLSPGNGVWAAMLLKAGFKLYDEERLPEELPK